MKTNVMLACAVLLGANFTTFAGDRAVILTTHVPVNDALSTKYDATRLLHATDDSNYADPRWHRVPTLKNTVVRTVMVNRDSGTYFITQMRKVPSVAKYPAEREPKLVWSRAFYKYVPYPVDYSRLNPVPQREQVGYTTIEPIGPTSEPEFTPAPVPPIAEGPRSTRVPTATTVLR